MKITLPDLDRMRCRGFTACGELIDTDPALEKWLRKQKEMVASFKSPKTKAKLFVHVMFGGKSGKHVHVDVVSATAFRERKPPKTTATFRAVEEVLGRFDRRRIDLSVAASFVCGLNKLPEGGLIRSASLAAKTGDVKIKQTQGTFTLSGTPLQTMRWSIRGESNEVAVYLETNRGDVAFDESYLSASLVWIRGLFEVFVLGKDSSAA